MIRKEGMSVWKRELGNLGREKCQSWRRRLSDPKRGNVSLEKRTRQSGKGEMLIWRGRLGNLRREKCQSRREKTCIICRKDVLLCNNRVEQVWKKGEEEKHFPKHFTSHKSGYMIKIGSSANRI